MSVRPGSEQPVKLEFQVLDKGLLEVRRISETDESIVEYARATTKEIPGIKHKPEKSLIRYMLAHGHSSPFEFPDLVFYIKAPLFVYNQWMRHRTAVTAEDGLIDKGHTGEVVYESVDSTTRQFHQQQMFSGRYWEYPEEMYVPPEDQMLLQSDKNMQASGSELIAKPDDALAEIREAYRIIRESRATLRDDYHLARERARIITPLGQYTSWYWKQNLWNLLHWLKLRREDDAQWEIRQYANLIEDCVGTYFPVTYRAWLNVTEGAHLTREEADELVTHLEGKAVPATLYKKLVRRERAG